MSQVGWALSQVPSGPHVRTDVPWRLKPRSQVKSVVSWYNVPPDWSTVPLVTAGSIPQSEKGKGIKQSWKRQTSAKLISQHKTNVTKERNKYILKTAIAITNN